MLYVTITANNIRESGTASVFGTFGGIRRSEYFAGGGETIVTISGKDYARPMDACEHEALVGSLHDAVAFKNATCDLDGVWTLR